MYYVIIYTVPPQFYIVIEQHTEKYVTLQTDCLTRLMKNCTKSLLSKQYNKKKNGFQWIFKELLLSISVHKRLILKLID